MICPNCGFEVKKPGVAVSFVGLLEVRHAVLRFYCRCGHRLREVEVSVSQAFGILRSLEGD